MWWSEIKHIYCYRKLILVFICHKNVYFFNNLNFLLKLFISHCDKILCFLWFLEPIVLTRGNGRVCRSFAAVWMK